VLAVAAALRWSALAVPHFDTDEPAFEGLAQSLIMNNGYTVRRVGYEVTAVERPLFLLRLGPDAREHGAILDFYAPAHQDVVDDHALSVRPPLFPAVLAASTALLASSVEVIAIERTAPAGREAAFHAAAEHPRGRWVRAQLAVALPPLLASLAVCALAFLAHRGSPLAAALGALAVATAPLDVWCAHRVTADTLTAALVGGSAVLLATRDASLARVALAGLLGGLAVLAKPSGVLLAPAYAGVEAFLVLRRGEPPRRAALRAGVFAGTLAVTGLWWAALQLALPGGSVVAALGYGGVGYTPEAAKADWPVFVRSRPFWIVPATTALLSPLLGVGAAGIFARARRDKDAAALAGVAALFIVMTMLWPAKENRYLLPAYVSFAAGFAWIVERLLERAHGRAAKVAVVALALAVMAPSAWYAREAALRGAYELTPIGRPAPG
jgi:hypothetical protein